MNLGRCRIFPKYFQPHLVPSSEQSSLYWKILTENTSKLYNKKNKKQKNNNKKQKKKIQILKAIYTKINESF